MWYVSGSVFGSAAFPVQDQRLIGRGCPFGLLNGIPTRQTWAVQSGGAERLRFSAATGYKPGLQHEGASSLETARRRR
ncbi:hypothetical protein [Azospirillum doebereinerae]